MASTSIKELRKLQIKSKIPSCGEVHVAIKSIFYLFYFLTILSNTELFHFNTFYPFSIDIGVVSSTSTNQYM